MALKWLLSSAFTQVFGQSYDVNMAHKDFVACPNEVKDTKEGVAKMINIITKEDCPNGFQMPLHYPRYTKADYEKMEEWKVDMLLKEYGLSFKGTLNEKRVFAIGAFLWI